VQNHAIYLCFIPRPADKLTYFLSNGECTHCRTPCTVSTLEILHGVNQSTSLGYFEIAFSDLSGLIKKA